MLNVMDDTINPVEPFLRSDRMPHIWCPGCGIGTTVNSFARALIESKVDLKTLALVSGIGCTGRVAGYVKLDSFHTTHGRAIPFATGLKLANPRRILLFIPVTAICPPSAATILFTPRGATSILKSSA